MEEKNEQKTREFRGLYKHVKISVKTLDKIIVACIAVILIVVALDLRNPGFTITFDSKGGTDVMPQNQMYGELLELPENPTREGYDFLGVTTIGSSPATLRMNLERASFVAVSVPTL